VGDELNIPQGFPTPNTSESATKKRELRPTRRCVEWEGVSWLDSLTEGADLRKKFSIVQRDAHWTQMMEERERQITSHPGKKEEKTMSPSQSLIKTPRPLILKKSTRLSLR